VIMESALTTIMDCEDSVAAVDAEDKVQVYRNWLGLMKGDLAEEISKGGKSFTRNLNADRKYKSAAGKSFSLNGRSLMLVRNVGHLMTNPAITLNDGSEIPEGIMDCMVTALIANASGIFGVYSMREVFEYTKFWAVGSGREFALGAMNSQYQRMRSATAVATAGIEAGAMFDKNSALPMTLYVLPLK